MKKNICLLASILFAINLFSQRKVCNTSNSEDLDLNSITKCTIEPNKRSKRKKDSQIKVKVSAKKRYFKKRPKNKKAIVLQSTNRDVELNSKSTGDVELTELSLVSNEGKLYGSEVVTGRLEKSSNFKADVNALKERLSEEKLSKALRLYYVDRVPAFKACKNVKKKDGFDCFNMEMIKHINKHFNYPGEAVRNQIEGEVWVRFIIDENGDVTNIKALGPDNGELLNKEAKRVVSKLQKFKPARDNGKRISVKYGFPINFSLEE